MPCPMMEKASRGNRVRMSVDNQVLNTRIFGWEVLRGFYHAHRNIPGIHKTYGYFFDHPVASLNQQRLNGILERCDNHGRGGTILDLCCGGGAITTFLALNEYEVTGIDVDEVEMGLANKIKTWGAIDSVKFVTGKIEDTIQNDE